jgi:hypothetical protein
MEWQHESSAPMGVPVIVAFHTGHGNLIQIATRVAQNGRWGDWDYINSHYGEPKYWASLDEMRSCPLQIPPADIEGPDCGCDGCTERYHSAPDE